ncbi:MAG: LptF/LptG family permease [Candidatus Aureabacteria bacterium]|nr:LptF/LptG family permease [Candidatus Auribacterota bacterium]
MRILDRYLLREFIIPLCYCLAAFFLVYIIYDLSAHLDDYVEYRIPLMEMGRYYAIQLPMVMVQLIPLSILLAIVYCLGMLTRHNEITAMRASGMSIYRIMTPFVAMGICFTALLFYLNEEFAPAAYAKSERLIEERVRGQEETFSKRRFPFTEKPEDFTSSQKDSLSMNALELGRNMAFYPPDSDIYGRKLVDLHYKIALPFVAIAIVLIAVPLAMRASRGGAAGSAGVSIALGISYYAVLMLSLALGRGGHLPAWLASWFPNILFATMGGVLIYKAR